MKSQTVVSRQILHHTHTYKYLIDVMNRDKGSIPGSQRGVPYSLHPTSACVGIVRSSMTTHPVILAAAFIKVFTEKQTSSIIDKIIFIQGWGVTARIFWRYLATPLHYFAIHSSNLSYMKPTASCRLSYCLPLERLLALRIRLLSLITQEVEEVLRYCA